MKLSLKKILLLLFVFSNIALLIYAYLNGQIIKVENLKTFLTNENFLISYTSYILLLSLRGLTLIPGTVFLIAGIYVFSALQVFFAIQIAIVSYCFMIYYFSSKLNFKIPKKILRYEKKIKKKEIPLIFALCFIPGISINVLIYFLSIIKVSLKKTLIGVVAGTSITSIIYISLIKGVFSSEHFFSNFFNYLSEFFN